MNNRFFGLKGIDNKTKFFIRIFNHEFTYNLGQPVLFEFKEDFEKYFAANNMKEKTENLKTGMDDISKEYVDYFMRLTKYWDNRLLRKIWSKYDYEEIVRYKKFLENFEQPFPDITIFNPYIIFGEYGLKDLPKNVLENINGKNIIDIGGFNGDTAWLFCNMFPDSKIFVYEPLSIHMKNLEKIIKTANLYNRVLPIKKGIGDKQEQAEIKFVDTETCDIATLDSEFADSSEEIGLIKMDVEGFESKVINGAINTIKKHKPVLAVAIYHNPQDFFEMKDKIKNINPDYKFIIRRSENINPQADLVLIAY